MGDGSAGSIGGMRHRRRVGLGGEDLAGGMPAPVEGPAPRPFSCLWFSDRRDEADFGGSYAQDNFGPADRLSHRRLGFGWFVNLAFVWLQLRQAGLLSVRGALAVAWAGASVAWDLRWVGAALDARPEVRTRMAVVGRVAHNLVVVLLSGLWFGGPVDGLRSFARFLLMTTGTLPFVFNTLAHSLLVRHHLAVSAPTVALMCVVGSRFGCTEGAITQRGAAYFVGLWRAVGMAVGCMPPGHPDPAPLECCRDLVVMSQVVFGFCLPSYALWVSEYRARRAFKPDEAPPLTRGDVAVHAMLFTTSTMCLWALLHIGSWH